MPHRSRVTFLEGRAGPLALLTVTRYQRQVSEASGATPEASQAHPGAGQALAIAPAGPLEPTGVQAHAAVQPRSGIGAEEGSWREPLTALVELYGSTARQLPPGECEVLYGRAGYLWALLYVRAHLAPADKAAVPDDVIQELVRALLDTGREGAVRLRTPSGLMYAWHDSLYLGAAHGLAGVVHVLLTCADVVRALDREPQAAGVHWQSVARAVSFLVGCCFPSGNLPSLVGKETDKLVQWCHGAPGLLQVLCAAQPHLGHTPAWPAMLEHCRKAATVVWERGLLTKGVGLCHGISGNAYALLAAARCLRASGDHPGAALNLWRAQRMALFGVQYWRELYDVPDTPASLYEGVCGLACLAADLSCPDPVATARFPGFELP